MKDTENVDTRCDDEIDELKKIFYRFFVMTGNIGSSEKDDPKGNGFKNDAPRATK